MDALILGNPLGLWALLGIPAVLVVHFLRPRSRKVVATTLFLLEHLPPLATTGRAWRRLRSTWTLWLQLLAVLLITWVLAEPRWQRPDSLQTIVVLLDATASMQAFHEDAADALRARAPEWERGAARTEWIVRETDLERPVLYRGFDRAAAVDALARWRPDRGHHDFQPALKVARRLARRNGAAILITDRPPGIQLDGVALLAVGRPLDNAGFAGGSVDLPTEGNEVPQWTVLLRHSGTEPAVRTLKISARTARNAPAGVVRTEEITLEPGALTTLRGPFPAGIEALEFALTADAFPFDDVLPLVVPVPRPLTWRAIGPNDATSFFRRFLEHTPGMSPAPPGATPDVLVYATNTPFNQPVTGARLLELMVYAPNTGEMRIVTAPVVADAHPWLEGLAWSGLLSPGPAKDLLPTGAQGLLWQGGQPLAWVERVQGVPRVVFGWNWAASNADRLPASAVLLHRAVEDARQRKLAPETRNVDTLQFLELPTAPTGDREDARAVWTFINDRGDERTLDADEVATLRAPALPGFFEVRREGEVILRAAAQFADAREADFTTAAALVEPGELVRDVVEANTERDHLRPLWLLLLLGVLLGSWATAAQRD